MIIQKASALALCALFVAASASLCFAQTKSFAQTNENSQDADSEAASNQTQGDAQTVSQNQAPSSNSQAPSLEDLGLSPAQTRSDPQLQARLDKRAHMLKIHQRLGLITAVPLIVIGRYRLWRGGQEHQFGGPLGAFGLGLSHGGPLFHDGVLRHTRARHPRDATPRPGSSP